LRERLRIGIAFVLIAAALAAVWIPLAPSRLFDFDAANFALALDDFNPARHQPQPPGYPLYVALTRLVHFFEPDVATTFVITGVIGAAVSVLLLTILGARIYGLRAGILAGILLLTNPVLWKAGMTDQVRVYLALISVAVALMVWNGRSLPVTAAFLGLLAGFRPEMVISMTPLVFFAEVRRSVKMRQCIAGAAGLALGIGVWIVPMIWKMGGPHVFWDVTRTYASVQAGGSSLVFGAEVAAAWGMFLYALTWAAVSIAAWIWAAPFVRAPIPGAWFLIAWFLPLFFFSIAVHIAAPGHALAFIPVLCLLGGMVLSRVRWFVPAAIAACAVNLFLFFRPPVAAIRESSYPWIQEVAGVNESTLERIDWMVARHPATLVSYGSKVSWRILLYYYPGTPLLVLPSERETSSGVGLAWLVKGRRVIQETAPGRPVAMPACEEGAWLLNDNRIRQRLLSIPGAEDDSYFVFTPVARGDRFTIGPYQLFAADLPCRGSVLR